jgi:hypothetical protein
MGFVESHFFCECDGVLMGKQARPGREGGPFPRFAIPSEAKEKEVRNHNYI